MIEDTTQTFPDQTIRQFLLGRLDPNEQTSFEHSLFVDENLEERVRLAQLELADDYSVNRLSGTDRDRFRRRFLLTADRQNQLKVSKALHETFAAPASTVPAGRWKNFIGGFDIRRHGLKYAFATLILFILFLAGALLVKNEKPHLVDNRSPRVPPKPTATAAQVPLHHLTNSSQPAHDETSPPLPLHDGLPTSVMLDSETPLQSAPTISVAGDSVIVQLNLNEPIAQTYDINVMTMGGESVFSASAVDRSEKTTLAFEVPANAIKQGDFQIVLNRVDSGSNQSATYFFRVR